MRLQHPQDDGHRHHPESRKEPALPAGGVGQKRKRRAGVMGAHHVEETGDIAAVTQLVVARDQHLGELVGQHDDEG